MPDTHPGSLADWEKQIVIEKTLYLWKDWTIRMYGRMGYASVDFWLNTRQDVRDVERRTPVTIDCHKCEYYYVSWDKNFPHGCKAMGFKSKQLPSVVVRKTTPDMDCLSFKKKVKKGGVRET